jgi:hypothetical protein
MLLKSLEPGRYHATYQQFETIRKLRAGFSNVYMMSLVGTQAMRTVGGDQVKHYLTYSPTQSLWFEWFSQGCLRRMGQDVRQDWAITLAAMGSLMRSFDSDWESAVTWDQKNEIVTCATYAVIAFCGSFRGNEVFLVDLAGLRRYVRDLAGQDHVIIPLLGRYKGEQHSRYHLAPLTARTNSGLEVRTWVERLVALQEEKGVVQGPAFQDARGALASARWVEGRIMDQLQRIKDTEASVIHAEVDCYEHFGISRSFHRGATSAARVRGVDDKCVQLINRWRKFEGAKGRQPSLPMHEHYSDIQVLIPELVNPRFLC